MRDLLLWRLLHEADPEGHPDGGALRSLLDAAAKLPIAERLPLLGCCQVLVEHADPALRAAGARLLTGASGDAAWKAIVALLDDADAAVREAAVAALRRSAELDAPRWTHALFHPRDDVRAAAVREEPPTGATWLLAHLVVDPAVRDVALARLFDAIERGSRLPYHMLPTIEALVREGSLPTDAARRFIASVSREELLFWLSQTPGRTVETADAILDRVKRGLVEIAEPDDVPEPLDTLMALFWEVEPLAGFRPEQTEEDPGPTREFFLRWREALLTTVDAVRARVAASIFVTAKKLRGWCLPAAEVCTVVYPWFLMARRVPIEVRRASVRGLYDCGPRVPKHPAPVVRVLVDEPVVQPDAGEIDLWALGGILYYLETSRYVTAINWLGVGNLAQHYLSDPETAAPFLCIPDTAEDGRQRLITEITRERSARRPQVYALLIHSAMADGMSFLDPIEPDEAVRVVEKLLAMEKGGKRLSPTRLRTSTETLGNKIADAVSDAFRKFLEIWMKHDNPQRLRVGVEVFGITTRRIDTRPVVSAIVELEPPVLKKLLTVLGEPPGLPFGKELKLANELLTSRDEELKAWARERVPAKPRGTRTATARVPAPSTIGQVDADLARRIGASDEASLGRVLRPCREQPMAGLCEALAKRPDPSGPNILVCTALLGCHDPIDEVDREFRRFSHGAPEAFHGQLDREVVRTWQGNERLPLAGHAWLCRWEKHAFAFEKMVAAEWHPPETIAQVSRSCTSPLIAYVLADGLDRLVGLWRFREKQKLIDAWTAELARSVIDLLDGPAGRPAARVLMHVVNADIAGDLMRELHPDVASKLPDLEESVREVLQTWVDTRGMVGPPVLKRPSRLAIDDDIRAVITSSVNLNQLEEWCAHENAAVVDDAALRLLELGERGAARLLRVLKRLPPVACAATVAASVSLWPEGPSRAAIDAFLDDEDYWLQLRFLAGLGLATPDNAALLERLIDMACQPDEVSWFQREDWDRLVQLGIDERRLALRLVVSPHPRAYTLALSHLKKDSRSAESIRAVELFLEQGTTRIWTFRTEAAEWLHVLGRTACFPILLSNAVTSSSSSVTRNPFTGAPWSLVTEGVSAWLTAGPSNAKEERLAELVSADSVMPSAQEEAYATILQHATDDAVRTGVIAKLRPTRARALKVRRIAENFAWGQRLGRELASRLLQFEVLAGEDLGYTKLQEDRVFINVLPMLRGERNGIDVVQALILHEIGHHVYHRGEEPERLWRESAEKGLGSLLNLVADEQLERSLRAVDSAFGDRLKRLAAYAFQHARKEMPVLALLDGLRARAFAVLTRVALGAARREGCVRVDNGQLLSEMEAQGSSFARFVRALRMGRGNRHGDEKVDRGLALFRNNFRRSSMAKMVEIARELREIFGSECSLLAQFGQDSVLSADASEVQTGCEGITQQEINEEIQRISDPRRQREASSGEGGGRTRWINVGKTEDFATITTVVPVPYRPEEHKPWAAKAAGPARQLRRFLKDLGVNLVTTKMRLRGQHVDRSRLNALVLRGDPRLLIAREPNVYNDLFIAAVIDCSGSMSYGNPVTNMEKAKLFGSVLVEACRGLPNVDLRLFGFTDAKIYDAGTAARPAVHGLNAGGGNNDAAGLWHAAQEAMESKRKAKVLVMISDGLPTECTVDALRGLVNRLSRKKKICCAQVAVQPLSEQCFQHYVLLNEADASQSARNFGLLMARLVRRTLSAG